MIILYEGRTNAWAPAVHVANGDEELAWDEESYPDLERNACVFMVPGTYDPADFDPWI